MPKLPARASIPDYDSRFPKITQEGAFWCIPASIENMLKFVGINSLSQTDIMIAYGRKFQSDALSNQKTGLKSNVSWNDNEFLIEARSAQLKHTSFGNFKTIVEESDILRHHDYEFEIVYGNGSMLSNVKMTISNGNLAAISFRSHVGVVLEFDNDVITYYDPWPNIDNFETKKAHKIQFNNDLLVLRKTV